MFINNSNVIHSIIFFKWQREWRGGKGRNDHKNSSEEMIDHP